jgi:hypothetical protein
VQQPDIIISESRDGNYFKHHANIHRTGMVENPVGRLSA